MPWSTVVHRDRPYIEVRYEGMVPPSELEAAAKEVLSLSSRHGKHFLLADASAIEGGHMFSDLFHVAQVVAGSPEFMIHREAVILPISPVAAENAAFWRTTASNSGIRVELFPDRPSAIAWLLAK
jgi:hypothetical protein